MSDYVNKLSELYEKYEEVRTEAKRNQDIAKDLKNEMMNIIKENGIDDVVVPGLDHDAVILSVDLVEREVLDKKLIAELAGVKIKDLAKIADWVNLTNSGVITPEMIEEAKVTQEREQFSAQIYKEEE